MFYLKRITGYGHLMANWGSFAADNTLWFEWGTTSCCLEVRNVVNGMGVVLLSLVFIHCHGNGMRVVLLSLVFLHCHVP